MKPPRPNTAKRMPSPTVRQNKKRFDKESPDSMAEMKTFFLFMAVYLDFQSEDSLTSECDGHGEFRSYRFVVLGCRYPFWHRFHHTENFFIKFRSEERRVGKEC